MRSHIKYTRTSVFDLFFYVNDLRTFLHCDCSVLDINECDTDPCENGGTCDNTIGSFTCTCVAGYDGATCQNGKKPLQKYVMRRINMIKRQSKLFIICTTIPCDMYCMEKRFKLLNVGNSDKSSSISEDDQLMELSVMNSHP